MRYPVASEMGDKKRSYGVVVPDLVGCYSAGETIDKALENAEEAIALHIDGLLDDNEKVPMPSTIEKYKKTKSLKILYGLSWRLTRQFLMIINITLPRRILSRLDARASAAGESRSGYIAKLVVF